MDRYDSIIIGAGHNGLVCAAYLAKHGNKVLVLEASSAAGGLAATREFHPGFHSSVAHTTTHFSTKVAHDLDLESHGFEGQYTPLVTTGLSTDRSPITIRDGALSGAEPDDATAYRQFTRLMHRCADALAPFWTKKAPRIGNNSLAELKTFAHIGLNIRRLGKQDMGEFLRIASLPVRDLMDEYFEDDLVKSTLAWDGLIGAKMAPRSPNSAVLALLYRLTEKARGAPMMGAAGPGSLINALESVAKAHGAEIRLSSRVSEITIAGDTSGLSAVGVRLEDGTLIAADRVVSGADPKTTFLDLVGVRHLDIGFTNRIRRLRCDGYVAKVHLALDSLPLFTQIEDLSGRFILAPDLDTIEFAFDDAKYGHCSASPIMEFVIPTLHDPVAAPEGKHVLSAHVMYVPYRHKDGWTDDARQTVADRSIETLAQYAPDIRKQIVHAEILTPADLEQTHGVTGGHWHHTEFAMDQLLMMRPTYGAAQYSTPIPGLYLCGAGCHPGGDLVGASGHNAAQVILS